MLNLFRPCKFRRPRVNRSSLWQHRPHWGSSPAHLPKGVLFSPNLPPPSFLVGDTGEDKELPNRLCPAVTPNAWRDVWKHEAQGGTPPDLLGKVVPPIAEGARHALRRNGHRHQVVEGPRGVQEDDNGAHQQSLADGRALVGKNRTHSDIQALKIQQAVTCIFPLKWTFQAGQIVHERTDPEQPCTFKNPLRNSGACKVHDAKKHQP